MAHTRCSDAVRAARAEHSQLAEQQRRLADKQAALEQLERQLAAQSGNARPGSRPTPTDRHRAEAVTIELSWRSRARSAARTIDAPPWLADTLGAAPESTRGQRRWRTAAVQIEAYRDRYRITEPGLGPHPHDLAQLRDWRTCQRIIDRVNPRARDRHLDRDLHGGRGMSM